MSGALIRYGAVRGMAAYSRRRSIGRAYRVASRARNYAPFARMAFRAFRGRRKRRPSNRVRKRQVRQRIGERVGTSNAKNNLSEVIANINTRTLYDEPLLNVTRGDAINERKRDVVNFRGIKFCMSLVNKAATANGQNMYFNYAIVSPKADDTKLALPLAEFFRGTGAQRHQAFDNALSSLDFRCLPINTDKYNVHKHKRLQLGPYSSAEGKNTRTWEFYMPLNRQIRYENGTTDVPAGKQMFLCYWCDYQDTNPGGVPVTNVADFQLRILKYFKEPATCC